MTRLRRLTSALLLATAQATAAADACPADGAERAALYALAASQFEPSSGTHDDWAVRLIDCIADPDPKLRDGVVFEALSRWLRASALGAETVRTLERRLRTVLSAPDPQGFGRPFAALVLSEVARADRLAPMLDDDAREALAAAAADYLSNVDDYRGFDPVEGWRHGVAHGADLVLQLAPNAALDGHQIRALRDALTRQMAPPGVAYVFGEPDRLARAAFYLHRSNKLDRDDWQRWLATLVDPAPLASWSKVWTDEAGLARRHDVRAFLLALLFLANLGEQDSDALFATDLQSALEAMMRDGG